MLDFVLSLHLWTLAILLNAWLMGFALLSFWVVRRWILPRMHLAYQDAYIGAAVAQSCLVLYALIAALTAVGVWQRYSQVSGIVSSEATIIANLWRDFGGYPPEQRDAMREVLRGYTEQVIHEAWPQQRAGHVPREGVEWMDRLQAELFAAQPESDAEEILHAETLRSFHDLVQARRQRLDSVGAGLPSVLWFVLLPGAMGCIVMFLLFRVENPRYHAVLLILLAGFISMVLFVIIGLDRPFSGDMGITANSYQLIYDHHMRP